MYTKEQFQAWVASKEEGELLGHTASRCNCPLANFYKAADPKYKQIAMGKRRKTWQEGTGYVSVDNEVWEMKFILEIDKLNRRYVTKEEVLHALV